MARRVRAMASTVLQERPAAEPTTLVPSTSASSTDAQGHDADVAATPARRAGSKWVIDENELLASTMEHRLWTYGGMGLMAAILAQAVTHIHGPGDAAGVVAALMASYVLSDLGTGIYHWGVDNYGNGATPMFGRQIAAFQVNGMPAGCFPPLPAGSSAVFKGLSDYPFRYVPPSFVLWHMWHMSINRRLRDADKHVALYSTPYSGHLAQH